MIAVGEPGAVVAREQNERVVELPRSLEGRKDPPHRRIDLGENIAVEAAGGGAGEGGAGKQRHMRHRVGEIQEERPIVLLHPVEKRAGALGVPGGEGRLILWGDIVVDDPLAIEQRQRRIAPRSRLGVVGPHVVGIGEPEPFVEAVTGGKERRVVAEMPLPHHAGAVAAAPQNFSQRRLGGGDAVAGVGPQRACDADPVGITAGEERRPRRRADRLGDVEVGEPHPFAGEPIEVRRGGGLSAVAGWITVAEVVGKDDDDVRRTMWRRGSGRRDRHPGRTQSALVGEPLPLPLEPRDRVGLGGGKVDRLGPVSGQIVERPWLPLRGDEFFVPHAHGPVPLVTPPRGLPERGSIRISEETRKTSPLHRWHERAVDEEWRLLRAGQLHHRGGHVDEMNRLVAQRSRTPRRDASRPMDDPRRRDPPFVDPGLVTAEGSVCGARPPRPQT